MPGRQRRLSLLMLLPRLMLHPLLLLLPLPPPLPLPLLLLLLTPLPRHPQFRASPQSSYPIQQQRR